MTQSPWVLEPAFLGQKQGVENWLQRQSEACAAGESGGLQEDLTSCSQIAPLGTGSTAQKTQEGCPTPKASGPTLLGVQRHQKVQKESCLLKKPTDLLPSIFDRVIAREITRGTAILGL